MRRLTKPCLHLGLLSGLLLAGCNDADEPATPAAAAVDHGSSTWGRLPLGDGELKVECPAGWSCKPDDEGRLRHERLAASVSLRRSVATDAKAMLSSEQLLRVQERRVLVEEHPHDLGLVQQTRQQLRGGAESRSWALLRGIDDVPIVCTGTASTTDYPDLIDDFDTICSSLEVPSTPLSASPTSPPCGGESGAPCAGPESASHEGSSAPALLAQLGIEFGMTPAQVAAVQPDLAADAAVSVGPWSVRAGFWGTGDTLTTLTATAGAEVDADAIVAAATETWGAPMWLDDGEARAWVEPAAARQVIIDAPAHDRLRVTWRQVTSIEALLGTSSAGHLGFERADAPLLGLPRAQLATHYPELLIGDGADARLALPPLPEGGVTVVELGGDPIDMMTVRLDVSRRPAAAREIEAAVEARRATGARTWTLEPGADGRLTLIVR